jgi:hypothetical protein
MYEKPTNEIAVIHVLYFLAQDSDNWRARVNTVMNLRVHKRRGISLSRLGYVSFSERTLLHGVS